MTALAEGSNRRRATFQTAYVVKRGPAARFADLFGQRLSQHPPPENIQRPCAAQIGDRKYSDEVVILATVIEDGSGNFAARETVVEFCNASTLISRLYCS
ncbi:hypothetical protein FHX06_006384 [Rhizobium sp. BK512]|uniref:hypothetical protein n=1 Tax=Rhizobium sp. BK512 TaxID=2587010 RepID=UPI00160B2371|nr:hypothetical protein [Rhizobium sp. BK512]MBB3565014.1 hypothetical protein [Rhizobium sp. BK512]